MRHDRKQVGYRSVTLGSTRRCTLFGGLPYPAPLAHGFASLGELAHAGRTGLATSTTTTQYRGHRGSDQAAISAPPPAEPAGTLSSGPSHFPNHHGEWNGITATAIAREYPTSLFFLAYLSVISPVLFGLILYPTTCSWEILRD